jgi:hypothetical protein
LCRYVTVVEFAGLKKPSSGKTFSPSDSRSASPGVNMEGAGSAMGHMMGHIGTEVNLAGMTGASGASLKVNLVDVAAHPSFASLSESNNSVGTPPPSTSSKGTYEHFAPL